MRFIGAFYALYICALCRCVDPLGSLEDNIALDLLNEDPVRIKVDRGVVDDIPYDSFFLENGKMFGELTEGQVTIWKAGQDERCTAINLYHKDNVELISMHVNGDSGSRLVCFEKVDGEWKELPESDFERTLDGLKGKSQDEEGELKISSKSPLTVDISDPDESTTTVTESASERAEHKSYTAKDGLEITSVTDGQNVIWEAGDGERCAYVRISVTDGKKVLSMYLVRSAKTAIKCFEKKDEEWVCVTDKEFNWKPDDVENEPSEPFVPGIVTEVPSLPETKDTKTILDVSKPDKEHVKIIPSYAEGIMYITYSPNKGRRITSVSDNNLEIWRAGSDETIKFVKSSIRDELELLSIYLRNGKIMEHKCFENVNGQWNEIDDDRFDEIHESMKTKHPTIVDDVDKTEELEDDEEESTKLQREHEFYDPDRYDSLEEILSEEHVTDTGNLRAEAADVFSGDSSDEDEDSPAQPAKDESNSVPPEILRIGQAIFEISGKKPKDLTKPIELNFDNVDSNIGVHEGTLNNFQHKLYIPKNGHFISKIIDEGRVIDVGDGKCVLTYVYHRPEPVLSLLVFESNGHEAHKFMVKDCEWKEPDADMKKTLETEGEGFVQALVDAVQSAVGKDALQ
ncbi:hypothetical protein BEWA_016600 [Theileria equi strain WA]|uniref:Uncharacterized protein n=1 Tax=Theileria equi strain WA TaxID=1537102 RepID=L1L994_THEEQ|nr:hypothetical protein BEWA_016600 [Theileria equi strain WA]EKX71982.1 hypothetical protein BEWA_016600 [Theileria equi strain WA]|eukprot:XP_004831434.1 hypothetical protein BEWA_016600 [Theileria equi strain WA]